MSDSEETIWDPISSLGRVMPPSDFVLDSSRSSFSQTKKKLTGKTFKTSLNTTNPNTYVKFIFLRTSPLRELHTVKVIDDYPSIFDCAAA